MASRAGSTSPTPGPPTQQITQNEGKYVLELYWLSLNTDERIKMRRIKNRLDVSSASVSEMISQLAEADIVDHRKYHGAVLTDRGIAMGAVLAWRYCVVESFFRDVLENPLDRSTAYELGYHLPEDGLVTLGEKLGMPCMRACEGTSQSFTGCQLRPAVEG